MEVPRLVLHLYVTNLFLAQNFSAFCRGIFINYASEEEKTGYIYGKDCVYKSSDLTGKVDMDTVKTLEKDGTTERTIHQFHKHIHYYHHCVFD